MPMLVLITSIAAVLAGAFTVVAGLLVMRGSWKRRQDEPHEAGAAGRSAGYPAIQLGLMATMLALIAQSFAIAGQHGSMSLMQGLAVTVMGAGFGANLTALATMLAKRGHERQQG